MNGYQLTRRWFNFAFENSEAKVQHTALYCWMVELNNRLGWKEEFTINTQFTMEGLSIGNKNTYLDALKDLEKWGFIKTIRPSINQNYGRVVSLRCGDFATADTTAMDTALIQQSDDNDEGGVPIVKQVNNETIKQKKQGLDFSKYEELSQLVEKWIGYRKSIKKPYKSQDSLDSFVKSLRDKSDNDIQKAEAIIEQSIANQWQGIFELRANNTNVNRGNSQLPVEPSKIVNYGKGNGNCLFDRISGKWYEPLMNGYPPKEIEDYAYLDQGNHSNYGAYVRWMLTNNRMPMPPEDTRYFPADWNFDSFVAEQKAIIANTNQ